jgi:trehalose/maltose transport system substrate-binding protein
MRKFLMMFLLMMFVVTLSACGKDDEKTTTTEESTTTTEESTTTTTEEAEDVIVKFAVQADSTGALAKLVQAFNDKDNGYTVEIVEMTNNSGDMHDQLVTSLSSGSDDYDVISMDVVWAGEFAAAGFIQPLDMMIAGEDWEITDFNAGSMASGNYAGKHYALPYFPDLGFLYFRSDLVSTTDAAKLQSGDYTWAELLTMAEGYATVDVDGIVYQSNQYEGLVCNLNEFSNNWQDLEAGLQLMKQFTDSTATPDNILAYQEGETHNAFLQGGAVFARNWPYMNGMVTDPENSVLTAAQVSYAPLPQGGTVGGWLLGINKNTDTTEGAQAFIKFVAGPEGQKINAIEGSYLPGFNALLEDAEVLAANALLTDDGFQNALQTTIARPVASNYSQVSDIIQLNAHGYLSEEIELATAKANIEILLNN